MSSPPLSARLKVLWVQHDVVDHDALTDAFERQKLDIVKLNHGPSFVHSIKEIRPDAVVLTLTHLSEPVLADLHAVSRQWPLPVIVFLSEGSGDAIDKAVKAEVSAVIVKGWDAGRLRSIIDVATARFRQYQTLKNALEEAKASLEDRKQIDRAKAILIKTQNYSEDQAYHTLRKLAMARNVTLGEMARNVIAMAELLQ